MLNEKDKSFIMKEVAVMVDNKFKDYRPTRFARISRSWFNYLTPMSILAGIWFFAQYSTDAKTRQFDNTNQKETVINHVANAPDPIVLEAIRRHTTDPGIHMPKDMKDSVYVTRLEYISLIKGNAVDMYNMKRTTDQVLEAVNKQNRTLKTFEYLLEDIKKNGSK